MGYVISKNQEIAIEPYEEGFNVYAVSESVFGLVGYRQAVNYGKTEQADSKSWNGLYNLRRIKAYILVFVMDKDYYFDKVVAHLQTAIRIHMNRIASDNGFLFYHYSEDPFGDLIFEGTSFDGKMKRIK